MNVVKTGGTYQIFGDGISTYDKLPTKVYDICFSKQQGFFLVAHHDLEVTEEKVYGTYIKKIDKILKGFSSVDRNFGVILSGPKGVGKSLFAKCLSIRAKEEGLPVLICSSAIPGVANFIGSIEQEVIVLFDEFEKNFAKLENYDPQNEMLSLFDGLDCGKKLFVVTCNEVNGLNDYLLNRPGRFHYHFKFNTPSPEEIEEYLKDKLDEKYYDVIDKVINFSFIGKITYDCLRAIVFELNQGYSLEETIQDLNITRDRVNVFDIAIEFMDGTIIKEYSERIDVCRATPYGNWFTFGEDGRKVSFWVKFVPTDAKPLKDGSLVVPRDKVIDFHYDEDDIEGFPEEFKEYIKRKAARGIKDIKLNKVSYSTDYTKYMV